MSADIEEAVRLARIIATPGSSVRIYRDPNIPLTRTNEDGTTSDALFWIIDGKVLVHPDRWDAFHAAIDRVNAALATPRDRSGRRK